MSKRRELEQQVEQMDAQIVQLNAQIQSLNKQIDAYRAQEQAIVQALTQAQNSASRHVEEAKAGASKMIEQAQEQADRTLKEAEAQKAQIISDAEAASEEAHARAAAIIEAAQAESARRLSQTEASVQDFQTRLNSLNSILQNTAEQARERAKEFSAAIDALHQESPEILQESRGLSSLIEERAGKLPVDYTTPQELMHSIYQLQGRELPLEETEEEEEPVNTEPALQEIVLENRTDEIPTEEPAVQAAPEEPEERVWTVDEIIKKGVQSPAEMSEELDVDLDSLLDEIIGE
jgi:cell division septum initiation protein DivIVA